jgi:hypothetical protein
MTLTGTGFPDRSLPRAADFAGGRQTRFREPLFLREVIIFNEGDIVLSSGGKSGVAVGGVAGSGCM